MRSELRNLASIRRIDGHISWQREVSKDVSNAHDVTVVTDGASEYPYIAKRKTIGL